MWAYLLSMSKVYGKLSIWNWLNIINKIETKQNEYNKPDKHHKYRNITK